MTISFFSKRTISRLFLWTSVMFLLSFGTVQFASAAVINLTTQADIFDLADQNTCSLREAIQASNVAKATNANATIGGCTASADSNIINLLPGTYQLTIDNGNNDNSEGDLNIQSSITINGDPVGLTTIDASLITIGAMQHNRVIAIEGNGNPGQSIDVELHNLHITGGKLDSINGAGVETISPNGTTTISDCIINNNRISGGGNGGGVANTSGTLIVKKSLILANKANRGGGIYTGDAALTTVEDTSILGNVASEGGGGIAKDGSGVFELTHSTLAFNFAASMTGGGGMLVNGQNAVIDAKNSTISTNFTLGNGGGINVSSSTINLKNVTLSANRADMAADVSQAFNGINSLDEPWKTLLTEMKDYVLQEVAGVAVQPGDNANGGGIRNVGGTLNIENTIIAQNFDDSAQSNAVNPTIRPDISDSSCNTNLQTDKNNFIGDTTGCLGKTNADFDPSDFVGSVADGNVQDAHLAPLALNGAIVIPPSFLPLVTMLTHRPVAPSHVIDEGANCSGITDQRTFLRTFPVGGACDIGALEYEFPNSAPTGVADNYVTPQDTVLNVPVGMGVLVNDTDSDSFPEDISAQLVSPPGQDSAFTLYADGSFDYTPNAGFNGVDTFKYKAFDNKDISNEVTVNITVGMGNSAPVAVNDVYNTPKNTQLALNAAGGVLSNDSDANAGDMLTAVVVTAPATGTFALNADGSFSYEPAFDAVGDVTFTYKVNDGSVDSNIATVTIHVNEPPAQNVAPVAVNDVYNTPKNTQLAVNAAGGVLSNDSDANAGDMLTAVLVMAPATGAFGLNADGSFFYEPAFDAVGDVTFTYKVNDGSVDSNIATVTIHVNEPPAQNVAPVAVNDVYNTPKNTQLNVVAAGGVLSNDSDANAGDMLTAVVVMAPATGAFALNADGSFSYEPAFDAVGDVTFTYKVNDGSVDSNIATVTIHVNEPPAQNVAPVAENDAYKAFKNSVLIVNVVGGVLSNDSDANLGDTLKSVLLTDPGQGSVILDSAGSFEYTPNNSFVGLDTFTYRVSDNTVFSNIATVTIDVVNTPPVANPDMYVVQKDVVLNVNVANGVLQNDTDVNNDPLMALQAVLPGVPAHGVLVFNNDGSFSYKPDAGFVGQDAFEYRANDGGADSNVAIVVIDVKDVPLPITNDDGPYDLESDQLFQLDAPGLLANDVNSSADPIFKSKLSVKTAHGNVVVNDDGSFTYTSDVGYVGPDSFTYNAFDSQNDGNVATVSLVVSKTLPKIKTASPLQNGIVDSVYEQNFTANAGTPPYTWSVIAGNLPAGFLLNPVTGTLSGNPKVASVSNFTVRVTDQLLKTDSKVFVLTINDKNPGGGGGGAGASGGGGNAGSGNNPVVLTPPYFGAGADGSCGNYKDIDKNDPMCKEYAVVTDLGFNGFADGSNTFGPKMIFRRAEAQKVVQVASKASYKDAEDYCKNVNPFLDVVIGKHWAVNRLCWAKNNRTATGFTNLKKFLPEKGVTAAEFAAMILRNTELAPAQDIIYKENLAQGKPWYTGYWNYVLENKLSSLKSPNKILTRSEAVHMLYLFNEKGLLKAVVTQ